jgi:hypothetical protein
VPVEAETAKAEREHSISGKCNKEWHPSAIVLCKCKSCMVKVEYLNPSLSRVSARSNEEKMDETLYRNIWKHNVSASVIRCSLALPIRMKRRKGHLTMTYLRLQINTGSPKLACHKRRPVWRRRLHSTQGRTVMVSAERNQSFRGHGISTQECGETRKPTGEGSYGCWNTQTINRLR